MNIELNPLLIIDNLDKKVPICILKILCEICNIECKSKYLHNEEYLKSIRNLIKKYEPKIVLYPCNEDEQLYNCVKFFNVEGSWNLNSINISLETYIPFFDGSVNFLNKFNISEKTSDNPSGLSILQIYRLCKVIGYNMNIHTSKEEMFFAVDKFYNDSISGLRLSLIESIKTMNSNTLIKLVYEHLIDENKPSPERSTPKILSSKTNYKREITQSFLEQIKDEDYLLSRITPRTDEEAIYLSYKKWNIFIGNSTNPLIQYKFLLCNGLDNYIPVGDGIFSKLYTKNKDWYNMEKNWVPNLIQVYSKKEIKRICMKEGYTDMSDYKSMKSFLKDRFSTVNFYFDIVPSLELDKTYIERIEIDSALNEEDLEILTLGILDTNEFYYFTIEELTSFFEHERMFIDPFSRELIDSFAINKLKNHCLSKSSSKYNKLLEVISMIERSMHVFNSNILDMKTKCFHNNEINDIIKNAFEKLIELGLTMRGSKLKEVLPLSSLNSCYSVKDEALIYQQAFDVYKEYIDLKNQILFDHVKMFLDNIYIIKFSETGLKEIFFGTKVKKSTSVNIKLDETLYLTFKKDEGAGSSCFRSNSNWILYTACWYMKIFCFDFNFQMNEIEEIL